MNPWRRWLRDRGLWLLAAPYAALLVLELIGSLLPGVMHGDSLWVALGVLLQSDVSMWGRTLLMVIGLVGFGLARSIGPNPAMPTKYGAWVAATPWRLGEPLPNGSPFLGRWDLAVVAALTLVSVVDLGWSWPTAALLFLASYAVPLLYAASTEPVILSACVVIGPLLFYPHYDARIAAAVFLLLLGLLVWALRCRLSRFPYEHDDWRELTRTGNDTNVPQLEYPYDTLAPGAVERSETRLVVTLLLVVLTWWMHAFADVWAMVENVRWRQLAYGIAGLNGEDHMRRVWWIAVLGTATVRWGIYRYYAAPPISLAGRVATGRLVIPSYDRLWLGPLVTVLVGAWAPMVWVEAGVPYPLVLTLSLGATLAAACLVGPKLEAWRLTGAGRVQKRWRVASSKTKKQRPGRGDQVRIELSLFGKKR